MNKKLTFFQMMYCWMFVYLSYFKYKRDTPEYFSCTVLSTCRMFNVMCISVLLGLVFDFGRGLTGPFMVSQFIINGAIFFLDDFLFFRRRNYILDLFIDYPQKEKLRGRTYFWIYIVVTVLLAGLTVYLTQIVEKPLLAV